MAVPPEGPRMAPWHSAFSCADPQSTEHADCLPSWSDGSGSLRLHRKHIEHFSNRDRHLRSASVSLTILILVVGAPAHHFCHVLRLLVNSSGPQDGSSGRILAEKHLNQTGLGKLAVELVEDLRVLREHRGRRDTLVVIYRATQSGNQRLKTSACLHKNHPKLHRKLSDWTQPQDNWPGPGWGPLLTSWAGGRTRRNMSRHVKAPQGGRGVSGRSSLTSAKLSNCWLLLDESPWKHHFHWFLRNTGRVWNFKFSKWSRWIGFHRNATLRKERIFLFIKTAR